MALLAVRKKIQCQSFSVGKEIQSLIMTTLPAKASSLDETCPEYVILLLSYLCQTLPVNVIARHILTEKNAIPKKALLYLKKTKAPDQQGGSAKEAFVFGNQVRVKKQDMFTNIRLCIDLLRRVQITKDSPFQLIEWHFL